MGKIASQGKGLSLSRSLALSLSGNETCRGHRIASSMDSDKTQARLLNKIRHFRWAEGKGGR